MGDDNAAIDFPRMETLQCNERIVVRFVPGSTVILRRAAATHKLRRDDAAPVSLSVDFYGTKQETCRWGKIVARAREVVGQWVWCQFAGERWGGVIYFFRIFYPYKHPLKYWFL